MTGILGAVTTLGAAAAVLFVVLRAAQRAAVEEAARASRLRQAREQQEHVDAASIEQARVDAQFADIVAAMNTDGNPS